MEREKYYSLLEIQKFTKIKSRQYIAKYINEGYLRAIKMGMKSKRRYAIKGEWAIEFMEKYSKGLIRGELRAKEDIKKLLKKLK